MQRCAEKCPERAGRRPGGSEHLELHGAFSTSLRAPGTESLSRFGYLALGAFVAQQKSPLGTPYALRKQIGHGNGAAMQSMENDETVSHPSHSRLEDADEARVSHIPTTTATRLDNKDKHLRLLHQGFGLCSSTENAGRIASDNADHNTDAGPPSVQRYAFRNASMSANNVG